MRIIYYSYWGTYAAYLTAALHTGLYPAEGLPSDKKIHEQFEMCRRYAGQTGNLIYIGLDDQLREVYCIGCRQHDGMVVRAIENMNKVFEIPEQVRFLDVGYREGILPYFIQYGLQRWNSSLPAKLFHYWFRQRYNACLRAAVQARQSLRDETVI